MKTNGTSQGLRAPGTGGSPRPWARRTLYLSVVAFVGMLVFLGLTVPTERKAEAIPVFARKYEKSCQTCHTTFPKLNPFGEAFKRAGYRFPEGEDEEATKQDPVNLGHKAHKKVFPREVWPGLLPGATPLSFQANANFLYTPKQATKASLANFGGAVVLNSSATLGKWFSVWAGAAFRASVDADGKEQIAAELERVFINVTPFKRPYLTIRVGRLEPSILSFSMHRMLGPAPWILSSPVRDNGFTLEPAQLGLELTGVVGWGRLTYTAGVVEGSGNLINTAKDFYGRLGVKIGGMRMDGVGGAKSSLPWRETSLKIGAFAYYGTAKLGDPALATQVDPFLIVGGDLNFMWRDLNLIVAGSWGNNERPSFAEPLTSVQSLQFMSQIDYVIYPWFVPSVRYELRAFGDLGDAPLEHRISASVYFLIRANIRAQVIATVSGEGSKLDFEQLLGGINMAF